MGEKSIGKWRMCEQLATMKNDTKTERQNADRRCSVKARQLDRRQRIQLSARIAAKTLGKLHRAAVGALILNAQMQNIV